MSKAILISIKPKWVAKILNGEKTIEIRKRFPKNFVGWVYIYCTKDKKYKNLINRGGFLTGMVVARFWCDKVDEFYDFDDDLCKQACLDRGEMLDYLGNKKGYAIHITNLEIFDRPKEISEFKKCYRSKGYPQNQSWYLTRAPQSWCWIEV